MAGPIKMPFGLWTEEGPKNHVLDGVHIPMERDNYGERVSPM